MAKIDEIKKIIGEAVTQTELENYLAKFKFVPVETDEDNSDNVYKFTNYRTQLWVEGESDEDGCVLVTNIKYVTKGKGESTRVNPFANYNDLKSVLDVFKNSGKYHHWLCGWLCTALGRRIDDIMSLKWSDIYTINGKYRERLTTLKEEKTGKCVGVRLNALAVKYIEEYCEITNTNPMKDYNSRIFSTSAAAFRTALKKSVAEVGITYPVSCHSFRKFYANTLYKLHPQEADNLSIIQSIFGHSDINITKMYIGVIDEKIDKYNVDYSDYMLDKANGVTQEISNSPVITIKAEDFRELLGKCFDMAKSNMDKFDAINSLLKETEQKTV